MKIKNKNDYDFKIKTNHKEMILLRETISNLLFQIPSMGDGYKNINVMLYDKDAFENNCDLISELNKLYSKINEVLSNIDPQ